MSSKNVLQLLLSIIARESRIVIEIALLVACFTSVGPSMVVIMRIYLVVLVSKGLNLISIAILLDAVVFTVLLSFQ